MSSFPDYYTKNVNTTPMSQTAPLFVSLYLVLLAFFILLNSLASYENTRQEKAIRSLKQTFSVPSYETKIRLVPGAPSNSLAPTELERTVTDINNFAKKAVRFIKTDWNENNNGLNVTLLTDQIFEAGTTKIRKKSQPLFAQLVSRITDWSGNKRIEITILTGTKDLEINSTLIDEQQKHAASIAKEFSELGVDQRFILAGFDNTLGIEYTSFAFALRDPEDTDIEQEIDVNE